MHAARNLKPRVPRELQAELRPYQKEGFRWLARLSAWDAGACLADDMGLGKTLQTLAVLVTRKSHGPTLVVAPTSVGPNWLREAARFTPSLRVRHFHGPGREALLDDLGPGDLLVTSYGTLTVDAEALAEVRFDTLVFDEAQAIKNPRTRRARAARSLDARWRLALTGTPVENHLGELWSIFSVLSPGLLGPWESFQERFAAPIERDGDRDRLEALSRLMRPFVLRRTKDKVAPELPARTEVLEPVELSPAERALYEAARREALAELLEGGVDEGDKLQVLAALTRLRRLACHPKLVQANFTGASSKLSSLLEHLYDVRRARQRALVFSQFTTFLDLVRAQLEREGFEYLYLDGRTSVKRRAELVEQWAAGAADLFLISLKAGGSGLNLTGADYVFHLDPWWNPAVEDQATDRTHRIGQERPVTVVRLIAQATIEEAVVGLHEEKRALADGLLSGTEAAGKLTSAQLVDLIRVGETEAFEAPEPREAAKPEPAEADDRLDAAGLDALGAALARHLDEAVERGEVTAGSAQVYLGSFNHLVRFAETRGGRRTLDAWLDQCVSAVETGRFDGPRSLVKVLRTVINRARRVTPAGPPR
jgi:SNF2 family DNA or RNA helicase